MIMWYKVKLIAVAWKMKLEHIKFKNEKDKVDKSYADWVMIKLI